MTLPKFIITMDGYFRLGMVNQHRDLLKVNETSAKRLSTRSNLFACLSTNGAQECIGGGYYEFEWASNRLQLDRASYDFGRPRWHLLDTFKVPVSYRGLRIIYSYGDDREDFVVSDELQIEYYDEMDGIIR